MVQDHMDAHAVVVVDIWRVGARGSPRRGTLQATRAPSGPPAASGAAALARAVERRSLSRSQSLDKGQVAEKLSEVELFEVPLGK